MKVKSEIVIKIELTEFESRALRALCDQAQRGESTMGTLGEIDEAYRRVFAGPDGKITCVKVQI